MNGILPHLRLDIDHSQVAGNWEAMMASLNEGTLAHFTNFSRRPTVRAGEQVSTSPAIRQVFFQKQVFGVAACR
jgi:hypothetical protein